MADNEVKTVFKAVDQATATIKKVDNALANTSKTSGGLKKSWGDLKTQVPMLGQAMSALSNPITLIAGGIGALTKLTSDSVRGWVDYNKQIREMTQVTGVGAEEISRIVQVADDWQISVDQISSSLSYANKNGFSPTIDNLARLADEYVNTADKTEFAKKAQQIFGRSYAEIIPLLSQGGDALRQNADAISDSLIATDDSINATREYELAMDGLNDAWGGLKNTLAMGVVPILTKAIDIINGVVTAESEQKAVVEDTSDALITRNRTYDQYIDLLIEELRTNDRLTPELEANLKITRDAQRTLKEYEDIYGPLNEQKLIDLSTTGKLTDTEALHLSTLMLEVAYTEDDIKALGALSEAQYRANQARQEYDEEHDVRTYREEADAMRALQGATSDYSDELSELKDLMNSPLRTAAENYAKANEDVAAKMADVKAAMDEIRNAESPTDEELAKLPELTTEYNNLAQQYQENAREHREATNKILLDLLMQRAAIDGITEAEYNLIISFAEQTGMIDQDMADAMLAVDEALGIVETNAAAAEIILDRVANKIGGIQGEYNIGFRISVYGDTPPAGADIEGEWNPYTGDYSYAKGGGFTVPPGYPNDSYVAPLHLTSGESVSVTPAGQSNVNNYFSMNVHTNAGTSTLSRDFSIMQSLSR